mgnify:CR=1 FL=1
MSNSNIRWITNDKHLHIETGNPEEHHKYSVMLKMGLDEENGDAVLYRSVISEDGENEALLRFMEEEVAYLQDMLEQYSKEVNRE